LRTKARDPSVAVAGILVVVGEAAGEEDIAVEGIRGALAIEVGPPDHVRVAVQRVQEVQIV